MTVRLHMVFVKDSTLIVCCVAGEKIYPIKKGIIASPASHKSNCLHVRGKLRKTSSVCYFNAPCYLLTDTVLCKVEGQVSALFIYLNQ